jgi:hypothetical protein
MNNIVEHPIFISSCYNTYLKHIDNNLLTEDLRNELTGRGFIFNNDYDDNDDFYD